MVVGAELCHPHIASTLMHAFASTKYSTSFWIPLLLEKLSSSLKTAKLDYLHYLGICCTNMDLTLRIMLQVSGVLELLPLSLPDLGLAIGNIGRKLAMYSLQLLDHLASLCLKSCSNTIF
eukprot:c19697_g1_i4 orf=316-675(+)